MHHRSSKLLLGAWNLFLKLLFFLLKDVNLKKLRNVLGQCDWRWNGLCVNMLRAKTRQTKTTYYKTDRTFGGFFSLLPTAFIIKVVCPLADESRTRQFKEKKPRHARLFGLPHWYILLVQFLTELPLSLLCDIVPWISYRCVMQSPYAGKTRKKHQKSHWRTQHCIQKPKSLFKNPNCILEPNF